MDNGVDTGVDDTGVDMCAGVDDMGEVTTDALCIFVVGKACFG